MDRLFFAYICFSVFNCFFEMLFIDIVILMEFKKTKLDTIYIGKLLLRLKF